MDSGGNLEIRTDVTGHYNFVVVGCGGIGSGTLYWLTRKANRTKRILGLEQFELGHSRGGSQDYSRIVRRIYHVEAYAKLAGASLEAWKHLEEDAKHRVVIDCGCLFVAEKGHPFIKDYIDACQKFQVRYEHVPGSELRRRYPQFEVDDEYEAVIDFKGGMVDAAQANAVHVALARQRGATVVDKCKVVRARQLPSGSYQVETTRGTVTCDKVIVTAGAWSNQVLGNFGVHVPLTVTQEQVQYYSTPHLQDFLPERFPAWIMNIEDASFYGCPIRGIMAVKIGIDAVGASVTGDTRSFTPDRMNTAKADHFVRKFLPKAYGPKALVKTCLYTMPPDRNFVVDTLSGYGHSGIIVCIGAGHAFKFAGVLGKNLADMALDRQPMDIDREFFSLQRRALTDPNFPDLCRQFGVGPIKNAPSKL